MFESKKNIGTLTPEQVEWLDECTRGFGSGATWKVKPQTGLVDVKGDFDCSDLGIKDFNGVQFGVVTGNFWCYHNKLTSLVGAPQEVGGYFDCSYNKLISLEGAPQKVKGEFRCNEFRTSNWNLQGWLELLKIGGKAATLVLPILPETELDKWMHKHPLDIDLLDGFPDIKAGVLRRTGLKDLSGLARSIRRGTI